ncbi:cobalt-zinc-cadmium resistance protein CzcB [Variibacter gotjawalensis]|uniref:Cobalt-zinc-cadmium resistance protein CzcB n=1 Tax=Variibacter gotjawalensis TaxID=1333996 RepID=A0A0S3PQ60_9BRAD|nr:HlyD family efflux transporter periplasmic adaptor subunit [Variibacter gotjawalensis]NIK48368.1 multidrug efflux pump subunit AcrA (membrane-fusion protein) [Variibacter gotjawalensis]RZS50235.1 multidrug efflux pump subunit AcrA (membrane-fusion protein) [Variibacter gotjawalensis]BAT58068.1 cobalt-zinc-cadmium resistance protein CzcB [Variibacter gotjawalensis]
MHVQWIRAFAAILVILFQLGNARAHEGHDHGPEAPAAPANVIPRGEARSDVFELVATAQNGNLVLFLDRAKNNEPILDATIDVETPEGPAKAEAQKDATYTLKAPWLAKGGHIDLIFTVTAGSDSDVLSLAIDVPNPSAESAAKRAGLRTADLLKLEILVPTGVGFLLGILVMIFGRRRSVAAAIVVGAMLVAPPARAHEGHDGAEPAAPAGASDRATRQPDGVIFVPKPVQRVFGLRTQETVRAPQHRALELPGRIIPDPAASGFVQTAIGGRLSPPEKGFPRLGSRVKKGDVVAYVTPPVQTVDVSDMRQRQGEIDQQIAIVERRVARYESLAPSGAVPRFQLEEAKLELQGLKDRRAALDKVRRDPEELIAPVDGIIAEGTPVAGQIAQSNSVIFQIVDPDKLWIEALSFEAIRDIVSASALSTNGKPMTLRFLGAGFTDRSQSVPVHFAINADTAALRAGQLLTVTVQTPDGREGIAIPRNAVVRASNGQHFVFEHVSAERFQPRAVRVEPLDAESVLILAGVEPGKRLVTLGAELLDQVR